MKKIYLIFSVFAFLFYSCDNEFDVNASWEEVMVVYGLLNPAEEQQYIRVNKAYLGEGNALDMASVSDSIQYNNTDLEVSVSTQINGEVINILFHDTIIEKDTGLFAIDNNIIYTAFIPEDINFFSSNRTYTLNITNVITNNTINANTDVIDDFSFSAFNPSYKFGFYNPSIIDSDSSQFLTKTLSWNQFPNGIIYQLTLKFNYLENGVENSLSWQQPINNYQGGAMSAKLEGARFFSFLRSQLEYSESVVREYVDLDLIMTVGTSDLATYINLNEPLTGIVQQRPEFTNIHNGLGIFSSRYVYVESGLGITLDTQDYIINELDRNFQ